MPPLDLDSVDLIERLLGDCQAKVLAQLMIVSNVHLSALLADVFKSHLVALHHSLSRVEVEYFLHAMLSQSGRVHLLFNDRLSLSVFKGLIFLTLVPHGLLLLKLGRVDGGVEGSFDLSDFRFQIGYLLLELLTISDLGKFFVLVEQVE